VDSSQPTLLGAAWKHRVLFGLILIVFIVGGLLFQAIGGDSNSFAAGAFVVLQDPDSLEGDGPSARFIIEQAEIMGSPIVADAAAASLADTPVDPQVTSEELMGTTSIMSSPDSSIVLLEAVDELPERAIAKVNALATAYQEVSRTQATQTSNVALERIDAQLASLDDRLTEVAEEITAERDAN
jgi:hypothetical protein